MTFVHGFKFLGGHLDGDPEAMQVALLQWSKRPQSVAIAQSGGLKEFAQYVGKFLEDAPVEFFEEWFATPFMRRVGADPFRRGAFAREAGFSAATLGLWNLIHAQGPVVNAACAMFVQPRSARAGISELRDAVRAYEDK